MEKINFCSTLLCNASWLEDDTIHLLHLAIGLCCRKPETRSILSQHEILYWTCSLKRKWKLSGKYKSLASVPNYSSQQDCGTEVSKTARVKQCCVLFLKVYCLILTSRDTFCEAAMSQQRSNSTDVKDIERKVTACDNSTWANLSHDTVVPFMMKQMERCGVIVSLSCFELRWMRSRRRKF